MKEIHDPFIKLCPQIDLHGYDVESALLSVDDFIRDNITLGNNKIVIIHGNGTGVLKKAIRIHLNKLKVVTSYKGHFFNEGITIVKINS